MTQKQSLRMTTDLVWVDVASFLEMGNNASHVHRSSIVGHPIIACDLFGGQGQLLAKTMALGLMCIITWALCRHSRRKILESILESLILSLQIFENLQSSWTLMARRGWAIVSHKQPGEYCYISNTHPITYPIIQSSAMLRLPTRLEPIWGRQWRQRQRWHVWHWWWL